jgi:uroporphyrinogen decarboxylase
MTNRERVIAALEHRQPDKTPYNIGFTQKAHAKMAEFYGDPKFHAKIGNHFLSLDPLLPGSWSDDGNLYTDEFGVTWNRTIDKDIGNPDGGVVAEGNVDGYEFPDPRDPRRYANFAAAIEAHADQFVVCELGFSLFERAWTLVGMAKVLMDMVERPEFIDKLFDKILAFNLAVVEESCKCPIDAIMFGDDWGQQRGLIMGPVFWRRFIKPRVREMYQAAKRAGKFVVIHSCGDVKQLFPDLIECGLDCFNPFQPEVMDVCEMKREFGDRLSFYGGISTQKTLPYGAPEDVRAEVQRNIEIVGKDGGYIASPAHAIPGDAPAENIDAMLQVLQNQ